ncbi:MAG TPA: NAD(P)-dependent alcohol dehydrogenase [Gemmatimonadales bacterium]|nr:NAD(P)-dependent alcohol dehydrogenase [Gemmatimonadales bacterium]
MRASVCTRYGPPEVLELREVATPSPGSKQVRIRIHATAVSVTDCRVRSDLSSAPLAMRFLARLAVGFGRPRQPILGSAMAGEIDATGKDVKRFAVGDRVFGYSGMRFGGNAEYVCLKETGSLITGGLVPAPSNLGFAEAAAIPYGGLMALHFLRRAEVRSGQRVLIYGASGAVGTAAVQLARAFGAEVTGVCSTANLELVRSLGAERVIDYTREATPGARYDLVLDAVGVRKTSALKEACRNALLPGGKYSSVDRGMPRMTASGLLVLSELIEAGKLKPVIDRRYQLEQAAEAHRYVELGHKKGNVVITVTHDD